MFFFYPLAAFLIVFCNILLEPLHSSASSDLELLFDTRDIITVVGESFVLSSKEALHIKHIRDFVSELTRLADCAIVNAQEEQRQGQGQRHQPKRRCHVACHGPDVGVTSQLLNGRLER